LEYVKYLYKNKKMTKKLLISEEEKNRILNLHKRAILESNNKERIDESFSQTVYNAQEKLKAKYGSLLGKSGKRGDGVDGLYGQNTRKAILQFQIDNNLSQTGKLDSQTLKSMGIKSSSPKPEEKKKEVDTGNCAVLPKAKEEDSSICSKISTSKETSIGNGGGEGCSEYVKKMLGSRFGHAWQAFLTASSAGSVIYNMFTDGSINWNNIKNSKFVNSESCACFIKDGDGRDKICSGGMKISDTISSFYPSKSGINISSLKVGDVVGMFYAGSKNKGRAFCQRAVENRDLDEKGNYGDTTPFTFNTHLGYVGAIKNGIPIIFHSVDGDRLATPATQLTSKGNKAMIAWAVSMGGKTEKPKETKDKEETVWYNPSTWF
jgi:peptidoglycan hydrolase-like protein with peptidoglycan-binding domain